MSKKSKNKKKKKGNKGFFESTYKSKGKSKGKKNSAYDEPKMSRIKPTVPKADVKAARKAILKPCEVPDQVEKNRKHCNHAYPLLSVAEYTSLANPAYVPMLELSIALYGEENVRICSSCYEVVVNHDVITSDKIASAISMLYVAVNMAISSKRMKTEEVEAFIKMQDRLQKWTKVQAIVDKVKAKDAETSETSVDLTSLNDVRGGAVIY